LNNNPRVHNIKRIIRVNVPVNSSRVGEIYSVPDGIYVISVAARILEMHPQTLRKYERAGLVRPSRTIGMLRLYSEEDIVRLRLIKHLVSDLGLNIAGVELSLRMFNELLKMRSGLDQAEASELKTYLDNCLQEMFNILKAK
jgi:MerR family transcriptional regulator/heat shock protein HspR